MSNLLRRTAAPAALIALLIGPVAHAQSVSVSPSGGVSAYDIGQSGISVEVDPEQGASLEADAGDAGGLSGGAGPQGAQLNPRQGAATLPGGTESTPSGQTPGGGAGSQPSAPPGGDPAPATPAAPTGAASVGAGNGTSAAGAADSGAADRSDAARRRAEAKAAADRRVRGVAPVLDLIERIPPALWAALAALGAIALGLWLVWVRGRRRLARNAWVDAGNGEMNVVAFETLLAQEWARSERYRRPLGLLLLELEESTAEGGRRPIAEKRVGAAREAITEQSRDADVVAHLSASRFAVICPESSPGSVETLAHALERSLEGRQLHTRVGMAARHEADRGPADLVSRAAVGLDEPPTWAGPVISRQIDAAESHAVPV